MTTPDLEILLSQLERTAGEGLAELDERGSKSYLVTYPVFIEFFRALPRIDADALILGASLVYSWMPTILTLEPDGVELAAAILDSVRPGGEPSGKDLEHLADTINHSMVGASKLLHFIQPDRFPIWDSRVCRFLGWSTTRVPKVEAYVEYCETCRQLVAHHRFAAIHGRITEKVGQVTRLRSAELLMYLGGARGQGHTNRISPASEEA